MEIWEFVEGSNRYQVSNLGRVKSVDYTDRFKGRGGEMCTRFKKGRILSVTNNGKGYMKVGMSGIGQKYIHRLVAEIFIPNPDNKKTVNHIDGNKTNNKLENLEWATHSENQFHSKKTGLAKTGHRHAQAKLTTDEVEYIRKNYIPRHEKYGCNALARKFGVSGGHVSYIIKGKNRANG